MTCRKISGLTALALTFMFAACGGDSGNNSKNDEASTNSRIEDFPKVETAEDLPNCSKNREDSIIVASDNNIAYQCSDKHWIKLGEPYENEDALPSCTEKREGMVVYVHDIEESWVCSEERWGKSTTKKDEKSDDTRKGEESKNSGDSSDGKSSASKEETSSSNLQDTPYSSTIAEETTCEQAAYTTQTAGPIGTWGAFGYVVPMKINSSKTQELYLAFDTEETKINGSETWETFSILIAQYDHTKGEWIPGTEIFSGDTVSALPLSGEAYSTVNTYGYFVKFGFNVKGTWLEKSVGKTIKVVVNFFPPGISSPTSGTGLDYYSIPLATREDISTVASEKLYYSACPHSGYGVKITKRPGCRVSKDNHIYQGDTVVWSIGLDSRYYDKPWFSINSKAGKVAKVTDKGVFVVYPTIGKFDESLTIKASSSGGSYSCAPSPGWSVSTEYFDGSPYSETLVVLSPHVKYCSCTASPQSVADATTAGSITLSVSGCESESPIADYTWGIKNAESNKLTKLTETSASLAYSRGERSSYEPFVTVTNEQGGSAEFECPKVTINSSIVANNVIAPGLVNISVPEGSHSVVLTDTDASKCSITFSCNSKKASTSIEISTSDGQNVSEVISGYYGQVSLSFPCPSVNAEITVSDDLTCKFW